MFPVHGSVTKDTEVNNNKYKDKVTAREIWVPSKNTEVLRTRTYTSFLLLLTGHVMSIKIANKIVGYEVVKEEDEIAAREERTKPGIALQQRSSA